MEQRESKKRKTSTKAVKTASSSDPQAAEQFETDWGPQHMADTVQPPAPRSTADANKNNSADISMKKNLMESENKAA